MARRIEKSQGNIAERFDALDDTTQVVIFGTDYEIGVYRARTDYPLTEIVGLRTRISGEAVPALIASMSKGTFYSTNMLAALCSSEMKKDRPIHYYGI